MSKPVILTGIRANNDLTIGNYFGAILPLIDMAKSNANEYQINLFVPDLHSFTTPIDHSKLQEQIRYNLRVFVAAGLPITNTNVHIYRQSYVPAHSELTWILDCFTGIGEMERMTQYKDKSRKLYKENSEIFNTELSGKEFDKDQMEFIKTEATRKIVNRVSVGLFNYPVLMTADVLLYGAKYVPVGDDQTQHLEFMRDIAERMNAKFGELFVVPEPVKKQHEFFGKDRGLRIMDLQNPTKKMSKSDDSGKGVIFLGDDPQAAHKKIMGATTDSVGKIQYDTVSQPGIANLLDIYELLGGDKQEFIGQEQYGPFKSAVADKIASFLADFQEELSTIHDEDITQKLKISEELMNTQANATLYNVQKAVGLR